MNVRIALPFWRCGMFRPSYRRIPVQVVDSPTLKVHRHKFPSGFVPGILSRVVICLSLLPGPWRLGDCLALLGVARRVRGASGSPLPRPPSVSRGSSTPAEPAPRRPSPRGGEPLVGFEPTPSGLKGRGPGPLDDKGVWTARVPPLLTCAVLGPSSRNTDRLAYRSTGPVPMDNRTKPPPLVLTSPGANRRS